ncbi:YxeA family protein [Paenibacillus sp. GCM10027626]|uniref:YxeA family protein n=1 Tax=Paenibacillus sp. GCM10027626 TaxID=3273411 RepID=UPI00362B343E
MKKVFIFGVILAAIIAGLVIFMQNVNLNRLGAEQYYVQLQEGERKEEKTDNGKKYISYEYTLPGFNKDGNEKNVKFTAAKELRQNAYLAVYVRDDIVRSYKEVTKQELPAQAKQKLAALQQ